MTNREQSALSVLTAPALIDSEGTVYIPTAAQRVQRAVAILEGKEEERVREAAVQS